MKFSLSWLKEYLETDASLQEITDRLTELGLEVESVHNPFDALKNFTVCKIIATEKHPNADKLKVCSVETDEGIKQIVCGAPNARAGIKAVLAKTGHIIPSNGMKLSPVKIRGVESNGMMCSNRELCLGDDHDGIIEAPDEFNVGDIYAEKLGLNDPIIEIAITPNRGDCLGVHAIARDLAASGIGEYKPPIIEKITGDFKADISVEIDQSATESCPVFMGRVIKDVKNCESPDWLKAKLRAVDINPKSLLVDVTNYLSYAIGRPMHVFDMDKLLGNKLIIRKAVEGDKITGLDENEYTLDKDMTIIYDEVGPVSIAGIMGGLSSGCSMETKNVFIESALFDAINIAATGRKLNILSDSRYRFERGVDAEMIEPALHLATKIILENCGGDTSEIIVAGEMPKARKEITFDYKLAEQRTGVSLTKEQCENYLQKLGFKVMGSKITVPSWRHDVNIKEDLVEEIIRLNGYNNIPLIDLPQMDITNDFESYSGSKIKLKRMEISRRTLSSRGIHEAMTWSFISEKNARLFGEIKRELTIENPISSDLSIMRPSLLPNLIEAAKRNFSRGMKNINLFEVGSIYKDDTETGHITCIGAIRTGKNVNRNWKIPQKDVDVYDIKADAISLMKEFGIKETNFQIENCVDAPKYYHPSRCAIIKQGPKNILGYFGEIHPTTLKQMGAKFPIVAMEIFLENIPTPKGNKTTKLKPLEMSQYQIVERDFAFVLDKTIPADKLISTVQKANKELIKSTSIFDVYEGDKLDLNKKSVAISVTMQSMTGTLTEEQINTVSNAIINSVQKQLNGSLRE